ncbi:MAG: prenyltransferase [Burkholderiales bacterium]|nr:prenyltransferase [Burkholderiales bacterium]
MPPAEPTLAALPNPFVRYLLATRPPFLSVSLVAALVGVAAAFHDGIAVSALTATISTFFALVAHASANVLNDYYDELNGTDRLNTERLFPFTGGSRFIQNGVLTREAVLGYGLALLGATVVAGLWLMSVSGPHLLWIGAAGCFVGWAYSGTPFKLNSRGLGELCIAAGFGLIAVGTDYVQRHAFSPLPAVAVAGYALLVTNILFVNQFPDRRADEAAGKRHWVVRLGVARAPWAYAAIGGLAYAWVAGAVLAGALPKLALASLVTVPMSLGAARELLAHAAEPAKLAGAIKQTIGAANLHGLVMAGALALSR